MRRIVCVEDGDCQVIAIRDLDRSANKDVLGREKLVASFVPAGHFVEDAMRNESMQNLAQRRERSEGFSSVAPRIDNLQTEIGLCSKLTREQADIGPCTGPQESPAEREGASCSR